MFRVKCFSCEADTEQMWSACCLVSRATFCGKKKKSTFCQSLWLQKKKKSSKTKTNMTVCWQFVQTNSNPEMPHLYFQPYPTDTTIHPAVAVNVSRGANLFAGSRFCDRMYQEWPWRRLKTSEENMALAVASQLQWRYVWFFVSSSYFKHGKTTHVPEFPIYRGE